MDESILNKEKIDKALFRFPKLKEMVGTNPDLYTIYGSYPYTHEYNQFIEYVNNYDDKRREYCKRLYSYDTDELSFCDILSKIIEITPWLNLNLICIGQLPERPDNKLIDIICENVLTYPIKKIREFSEQFALGGILLNYEDFETILIFTEKLLENYPEFYGYNYGNKICTNFWDTLSEMKVYDQLFRLGLNPEHEPDINGTDVNPDFCICDDSGKKYIVEVKCRHESFEEILQSCDMSEYLPSTYFGLPEASTRKTIDVIISTLFGQIKKLSDDGIEIPVILIIESICDYSGFSLNIDPDLFNERLLDRYNNAKVPNNLCAIFLFSLHTYEYRDYVASVKYPALRSYYFNQSQYKKVDTLEKLFTQDDFKRY